MVFVMKCIFFNEILIKFKIQMMMPIKNESLMIKLRSYVKVLGTLVPQNS